MLRAVDMDLETRRFRADAAALSEVRSFVRDRTHEAGIDPQTADDVLLAVSEACANVVLHSSSEHLDLSWVHQVDRVEVRVKDQGVFKHRPPDPDLVPVGGHGIRLMTLLVDRVLIRRGSTRRPGTTVVLVKAIPAAPHHAGAGSGGGQQARMAAL